MAVEVLYRCGRGQVEFACTSVGACVRAVGQAAGGLIGPVFGLLDRNGLHRVAENDARHADGRLPGLHDRIVHGDIRAVNLAEAIRRGRGGIELRLRSGREYLDLRAVDHAGEGNALVFQRGRDRDIWTGVDVARSAWQLHRQ